MRTLNTVLKRKTNNNEIVMGTLGPMRRVKNFLPSPEELVLKKPTQMISLRLDTESIRFFKREAARLNTSYQGMIRMLIQKYVDRAREGVER